MCFKLLKISQNSLFMVTLSVTRIIKNVIKILFLHITMKFNLSSMKRKWNSQKNIVTFTWKIALPSCAIPLPKNILDLWVFSKKNCCKQKVKARKKIFIVRYEWKFSRDINKMSPGKIKAKKMRYMMRLKMKIIIFVLQSKSYEPLEK